LVINGPGGSGKSYCIMNNIINALKEEQKFDDSQELCTLFMCFASQYSIDMFKKEIEKHKIKSRQIYLPCNYLSLNFRNLNDLCFYFINTNFFLLKCKVGENVFFYDFVRTNTIDLDYLRSKLKESKEIFLIKNIETKIISCSNESINPMLNAFAQSVGIVFYQETRESVFEYLYKKSLFFAKTFDLANRLKTFETLGAFDDTKTIHIFVDDIMASIWPFNSSNIMLSTKNKVYRSSKKLFDYLLPFYEYSNLLRYFNEHKDLLFESFGTYKQFIVSDLNRLKENLRAQSEKPAFLSIKLTDTVNHLIKSLLI
jgi:hypothetical protein